MAYRQKSKGTRITERKINNSDDIYITKDKRYLVVERVQTRYKNGKQDTTQYTTIYPATRENIVTVEKILGRIPVREMY